ncbi:unnamed protein product [Angiostrongylus costaricensis]|uniref:Secreted protein n=1 Tax=Angiostrongylus costaricensis TaxID=334426 RepID=A0A0R3PWG0_ANGCS|nr:unnamed protein product [Angiostrongylus costaricensis]
MAHTRPMIISFSCVHPWMMLMTVKDLRRKLCVMYGIQKHPALSPIMALFVKGQTKQPCYKPESRLFWKTPRFQRKFTA